MNEKEKQESLQDLEQKMLRMRKLPLAGYRKKNGYQLVIGEGDTNSDLVFVGEAPGKNEALSGRPFCGASGEKLEQLLSEIKLQRDDVYITNIVKDRPPENRDPTEGEITIYGPLLLEQLRIMRPKIIAPLGRFSSIYIMKQYGLDSDIQVISSMHGKVFDGYNKKTGHHALIIPLFHPAAAIYNQKKYPLLVEDMKIIKKVFTEGR